MRQRGCAVLDVMEPAHRSARDDSVCTLALVVCRSCVLWVPIDVVKERMQIQRVPKRPRVPVAPVEGAAAGASAPKPPLVYKNGAHALRSIIKSEGVVGLYRGYGATLLSFGPFSALFFMMHEEVRAA